MGVRILPDSPTPMTRRLGGGLQTHLSRGSTGHRLFKSMWKKIVKALAVAAITPFLESFATESGNKIAEKLFGAKDDSEDEENEVSCGRGRENWCDSCKEIADRGYSDNEYTYGEETLKVRVPISPNKNYVAYNLKDLIAADHRAMGWIYDRRFKEGAAFKFFRKGYGLSLDKASYLLGVSAGELKRMESEDNIPGEYYEVVHKGAGLLQDEEDAAVSLAHLSHSGNSSSE